ncbi:PKD domain-containing protein, partial [bacterium]|nr:PKD domain-containing protein [bacterium]
MLRYLLSVFYVITFTTSLFAQPDVAWWRMYDYGRNECFTDIYTVPNDGYVMCGLRAFSQNMENNADIIITRIDDDGGEIWHHSYGDAENSETAWDIIETDFSTFITACNNERQVAGLHVDPDGEMIWFTDFASGAGYAVIELKSGEYWICGISNGQGYIVCFNFAGRVLWDERYGGDRDVYKFKQMRETVGGVVLIGQTRQRTERDIWVAKVNFEGDLLWERFYDYQEGYESATDMVAAQDSGFVIAGYTGDILVFKIDDEGWQVWAREYDLVPRNQNNCCLGVVRLDDGGFAVVGWYATLTSPFALRLTSDGNERWQAVYDGFDRYKSYFDRVVVANDNSIIACGSTNNVDDDEGQNGLIVKLEYDQLAPQFIAYSPEDTMLTILQHDTVNFWVSASDGQNDSLSFLWTMDDSTLSTDTTVTVVFDELGEFEVRCRVTDDEFSATITWHVRVMAFYIESFTPDTLEMTVQRNSSVDFALEVRALEDVEFNYLWTLIGRGQQRQVGEEESV